MEVDEEGCADATGKSPPKGSLEVPVIPVNVSMMTTAATNKDMTLTAVPIITNKALHCQHILQAEKDASYQKTRYDAALGFVNVANIICDQDLLDKMTAAKLTKDALTKAGTEYKAALQRCVASHLIASYLHCGRSRNHNMEDLLKHKRIVKDRSMVAALLLTTPRPVPKSSSDDLAPTHHSQKIRIQSRGRTVSATPRMLHIEQASSPE
ncbi:hypothetical protein CDAR_263751 [Caerostris darwini]|uniref:Uncharacterized protein n=1 Tax=Caerostris darwini TaxID=1538125 RepID=A0AAV4RYE3_9ARAC|nr:hypothetical protein CDAR_263751 [Caerostris darwini]